MHNALKQHIIVEGTFDLEQSGKFSLRKENEQELVRKEEHYRQRKQYQPLTKVPKWEGD